ncbi:MAG: hypothetical protein OEV00_08055 [Acidobacteriota bacterium]|nr:hypothetical protein [Acidobacteriota bacterium]MDH3785265.1 hypothetical protein [Acidobacteriota bacterium]
MSPLEVPDGYRSTSLTAGWSVVHEERRAIWKAHGLDDPGRWKSYLAEATEAGGRGGWRRVDAGHESWVLKQLGRGGLTATLWRDRFLGSGRMLANVTVPVAARRRGVATPEIVGALAVSGPPLLYRGWLAIVEETDTRDLARRLVDGEALDEAVQRKIVSAIRKLHDAGIEHRDLNLGNILVSCSASPTVTILDLDRARVHDGPLDDALRERGVRRLLRSYRKLRLQHGDPVDWDAEAWPDLYRSVAHLDQ